MNRAKVFLVALLGVLAAGCGQDTRPTPVAAASDEQSRADDAMRGGGLPCGVEGQSVACTGPGGCSGGQLCSADGSFGDCDCGASALGACAPAGLLFHCVGEGGCIGSQACAADGSLGACECEPAPGSVAALTLDAPAAGARLSDPTVVVRGEVQGAVERIEVSIAGGPWLHATLAGEGYALSFETAELPEGPLTIVVQAHGHDGGVEQRFVQVTLDRKDPLIGTWSRVAQPRYGGGCLLSFGEGGLFGDNCGQFYRALSWRREAPTTIQILNDYGEQRLGVTLSADGTTLTLQGAYRETLRYERIDDAYVSPLPPYTRPLDDGGVDFDGGI